MERVVSISNGAIQIWQCKAEHRQESFFDEKL
jgi:hypothetical protein